MKNLKLDTVKGLTRLMNEMNNVFTKKISEAELNEAINNIDNSSFLECRQLFESISDKLYDSKNGSKLLAKYVKTIKENSDLKRLYVCADLLKNTNTCKNPELFVNEVTNLMTSVNKKNMNSELSKVRSVLKEAIVCVGATRDEIISSINEDKEINNDINYILTEDKKANNLVDYTNAMNSVISYVSDNASNRVDESVGNATIEDVEKLISNELELWESRVVEKLVIANLSGNSKKGIFEEYKKNCLSLIDNLMEDEDNQTITKAQLSTMKEGLDKKVYRDETANDDILKLAQLENTLQN